MPRPDTPHPISDLQPGRRGPGVDARPDAGDRGQGAAALDLAKQVGADEALFACILIRRNQAYGPTHR